MLNSTDSEKIRAFIEGEYPHPRDQDLKRFVYRLWNTFQDHNLNDSIFVTQFTSGCRQQLVERYTEMLFAWHFTQLGFRPTSKDMGPDLYIEHGDKKIWIEIITPRLTIPLGDGESAQRSAKAIEEYLAPPPNDPNAIRVTDIPTEQILSRWTSALKEKREKLTGTIIKNKKTLGYLDKNIVQTNDIYVIAINSISLGHHGFRGISQLPNAVEATLGVGPIEITINRKTSEIVSEGVSFRPNIINHNQSNIRTDSFLNPNYKEVSALIANNISLESNIYSCSKLPIVIVHNPHALNCLPQNMFGGIEEYVAENKGDFWEIRNIMRN